MYGRSHLESEAAMGRLAAALSKLAPEDEVALMTTWVGEGREGEPVPSLRTVSGFTRDRAETAAALRSVPRLVGEQERLLEDLAGRRARLTDDLRLDVVWRLSEVADEIIPLGGRSPNSRFIDDMLARYSLGFTLAESERDDGRLHALAVKVRARDARGGERKLLVRARRGYYASVPRRPRRAGAWPAPAPPC